MILSQVIRFVKIVKYPNLLIIIMIDLLLVANMSIVKNV